MAHGGCLFEYDIPSPAKRSRLSLKWNQQLESNLLPPLKPRSLFSPECCESQQESFTNNNKENLPYDNIAVQENNSLSNSSYALQSAQSSILTTESALLSQEACAAGLPNCGNTCYVNSILQVLRYTPNFTSSLYKLITSHRQLVQISSNSVKLKEAEFLSRLNKLYMDMKKVDRILTSCKSDYDVILKPLQLFLKCLREISPTFEEGEQHDAHELLLCIISAFELLKQNIQKDTETFTRSKSPLCNSSNSMFSKSGRRIKRPRSFEAFNYLNEDLNDVGFEGKICHGVKCLECENIRQGFEVFSNLEVAVADHLFIEDTVDLRKCLIQSSFLSGENKYFCENCYHYNEANMYARVVSPLPSILLIHMSWLKQSSDITSSEKDYMRVLIPLHLNTSENHDIFDCSQEVVYRLYAVVLHLGNSSEGGHYISFVKEESTSENSLNQNNNFENSHESESRWLLFNDESVTAINVKLTDTFPYYDYLSLWASPCMIFYQKA